MKANCTLAVIGLGLLACISSAASERVTVDNYIRAETDVTFGRYVRQNAFGKFLHIRTPVPIDKQDVIRMNRDTLYSAAILDLTEPATIVKPERGGRFQSMMVINQDHSMLPVEHGSGEFTLTKEKVGTRYAAVLFRTFVNPGDPADVKAANDLQDRIQIRQKSPGTFEVPDWDVASLDKIRSALNELAATLPDFKGMFGDAKKLDPIRHLLGTAAGWGGNPDAAAVYDSVIPEKNDGKRPYALTVKEVPVDGFWSITVYNKAGFMEENDQGAYSFNNVTATKNADGSITIDFGGGPGALNNLPITPGWNYTVRLYQPKPEIINGSWSFPRAQTVMGSLVQEATPAEPQVFRDGDSAKYIRVENMHQARFIEIFLAYRDAKSGKLVAACYNTALTTDGKLATKDTAPQALVEGLDFAKMKQDFSVLGASLNGPKLWLPDWAEIDSGVVRGFNGLKAAWVATLDMGDNAGGVSESTPYKPMSIARKSGLGYNKGTTVLLLDDAEGNTWIMKGFQLGLTPKSTYEQFVAAGQSQFKKLPPGWKFRVKTLEKDLIENPEGGVATIMPDEFFNIYDKTGPGMSNYKP